MSGKTVRAYVDALDDRRREVLATLLDTVLEELPDGVEVISYGIPTIKVDGRAVVHLAAWKSFASLYPVPPLDEDPALEARIAPYRGAKATARFPYDQPVPVELVTDVVRVLRQRAAAS